jgi:hypothetical protein
MIAVLTSVMLAGFSSSTAGAQSACGALGGTVGPDQTCHAHIENDTYTVDFRFPVDYPDQGAMTDVLTQRRDDFIDWITRMPNTYPPSSTSSATNTALALCHQALRASCSPSEPAPASIR